MISGELLYIVPGSPVLHDRELETVGLFEAHARPRVARSRGGARAAEVNECEQLPSVLSDTREASAVDSSACRHSTKLQQVTST